MNFILGFNIGNTNTKMGIFGLNEIIPAYTHTYPTDKKTNSNELIVILRNFLDSYSGIIKDKVVIAGIAFSSVVTEVNKAYHVMSSESYNIEPLEIRHDIKLGIKLLYENPNELGADRISNAVAAHCEYKKDSIVIDLGTAYTFNVIKENGNFDGGLIGPGIGLAIDSLAGKTSKLMRIDFGKPEKLVATNTGDAIKSGIFYGYVSLINGIIAEIKKTYNKNFLIILTGGFSQEISKYLNKKHILDPILTLKGIKYLYDLNKKS
jgi:type III pantothenate kinase